MDAIKLPLTVTSVLQALAKDGMTVVPRGGNAHKAAIALQSTGICEVSYVDTERKEAGMNVTLVNPFK